MFVVHGSDYIAKYGREEYEDAADEKSRREAFDPTRKYAIYQEYTPPAKKPYPTTSDQIAFWMVWSPTGNPPTFQHSTRERADAEAERLARVAPGHKFYVLQAVCSKREVGLESVEIVDPDECEIPF